MGLTTLPGEITLSGVSLAPTFMQMDFGGLLSMGVLPLITAIVTFTICDMFDTCLLYTSSASKSSRCSVRLGWASTGAMRISS